jgi:uncharacterized OB-fold protein
MGADASLDSGNLHEELGEAGVAHPMVMLAKELEQASPGDKMLLLGWGQGCDAILLEVTDAIKNFKPHAGLSGMLAAKDEVMEYTKYLKFRELLQTEMGIRAEISRQTALTALWRDRKLVLGLVGGKCQKCGTKQLPMADICVNPACRAVHSQVEQEFATTPAKVKAFTGDLLAVSVEPPAIYGMVAFDGGGRLMVDFTDCKLENMKVGMPATMSFRQKYYDKDRGFSGYFWKAVPKT